MHWTDWTSAGQDTVAGVLNVNGTPVNVTFSGPYSFAQTNGGTNYWVPPGPYTGAAVDNPPPDSDIIALNQGGRKVIQFSAPIQDPLIGLVSWNGNIVDFGVPIEILSFGPGFWGFGTPVLNGTGTGFFGAGEVHGVIRLPGSHSQIIFSDTSENWHGISIAVAGLAPPNGSAPEPATLGLIGLGLAGLAARRRRKIS